jgi:hypothetical protein
VYWSNKLFLDTQNHFGQPFFTIAKEILFIKEVKYQNTTGFYLANLDCCFVGREAKEDTHFQMTGRNIIIIFPVGSGITGLPQGMIKIVLWSILRLSSISDIL